MENHVFVTNVLVPQNTSLTISTTTINMNTTQTPEYLKISDIYKIGIFTGIIMLSVIGNATVIFAIIVYSSLHSVTNYFLFNMAAVDLLVTVICMPLHMCYWLGYSSVRTNEFVCKATPFLDGTCSCCVIYTLMVIAFDRYSTIVKPLRRKITRRHCLLIVLLVWWVSMVTVSPTLFVYQVKFDEAINRKQCDEYGWSEENRTRFSYALTVMIYFLPLIILTVWYTRIVHYIWFRKIPGIENLPLYMHMKMKKKYFKRRKLIRMLLVVVITFALCNLPHHVISILWYSRNELNWTAPRSMIFIAFHAEILLYLNAALNPLVYGFLHGKIRYVIFKRFLSNRSHKILRLLY